MTWDLVARLFLLPLTIMQRISRNVINIFSRALFSSDPTIKPPPRATSPASSRRSSELLIKAESGENTKSHGSEPINYALKKESFKEIKHFNENKSQLSSEIIIANLNKSMTMTDNENRDKGDDNNVDEVQERAVFRPTTNPVKLALVNELTGAEQLADVPHHPKSNEKRLNESLKRSEQEESEHDNNSLKYAEQCHQPKRAKLSKVEGHIINASSSSPSISTSAPASDTQSSQKKRKKPKKKRISESSSEKIQGGDEIQGKSRNMGRIPPNYFIAVEVSSKDIISKVDKLQQALSQKTLDPPWHDLKSTEIFKDAMVPVTKLHFTLYVMNLKNNDEIERAKLAVTQCGSEVLEEFKTNPLDLTIEGLGHFKNSVIFAQIKGIEAISRLTKLSDLVREKLRMQNIFGDERPLMPHMTIAKISRSNKLHKRKIRSFPPDMMKDHESMHFGIQRVEGIQLLAMQGEDKIRGYYRNMGEFRFVEEENPVLITEVTEPSSSKSPNEPESNDAKSSSKI